MGKFRISRTQIACLLAAIFLLQAAQFLLWLGKDDLIPAWDQSWHAMMGVHFYNLLTGRGGLSTEQARAAYPIFGYAMDLYPPFYHLSTVPFYLIFGTAYRSALLVNLAYLAVMIFSCYVIGWRLADERAGLIVAFLSSTVPVYTYLTRTYLVDYALSSLVALGFAALLLSDNFRNARYSALFGAVFGIGMLTKWTYFVYLEVPICAALYLLLKDAVIAKKGHSTLKTLVLPTALAALIMLTWYTPHRIGGLVPQLMGVSKASTLGAGVGPFSYAGIVYYLPVISDSYSPLYLLIFAASTCFLILSKKKWAYLIPCLLTIFAIYFSVTLLSNRDQRFIAPIYIYFIALSAVAISKIRQNKALTVAIASVVVAGLIQNAYLNLQYPVSSGAGYDINGLLSAMNESGGGKPFSMCIIAESKVLNDVNVPYASFRGGYPVSSMIGNGCNPLNYDYSLLGPIEDTWRSRSFNRSRTTLKANMTSFNPIYSSKDATAYKRLK